MNRNGDRLASLLGLQGKRAYSQQPRTCDAYRWGPTACLYHVQNQPTHSASIKKSIAYTFKFSKNFLVTWLLNFFWTSCGGQDSCFKRTENRNVVNSITLPTYMYILFIYCILLTVDMYKYVSIYSPQSKMCCLAEHTGATDNKFNMYLDLMSKAQYHFISSFFLLLLFLYFVFSQVFESQPKSVNCTELAANICLFLRTDNCSNLFILLKQLLRNMIKVTYTYKILIHNRCSKCSKCSPFAAIGFFWLNFNDLGLLTYCGTRNAIKETLMKRSTIWLSANDL